MYNLKAQGFIDHNTISFFIKSNSATGSIIKFGSYDLTGIMNGQTLQVYETVDRTRWAINGNNILANDHVVTLNEREFSFNMHLPYIYIPSDDFKNFAVAMAQFQLDIKCSDTLNYCKLDYPCSQATFDPWRLKFNLYDSRVSTNYQIPFTPKYMIDGASFKDPNTCYFPIFKSMNGVQDTWYIGNLFINYFYLVFDMSPLDEFGKDYI